MNVSLNDSRLDDDSLNDRRKDPTVDGAIGRNPSTRPVPPEHSIST